MKKHAVMLLALAALFAVGCHRPGSRASGNAPVGAGGQNVSLALTPGASEYTVDAVARGAVHFTASIENKTLAGIILAHPIICVPAGCRMDRSLNFTDRCGTSEILLTIEKPDGQTVVLRDGPHFFDPHNTARFSIGPGGSASFRVGWFFLNARGRWQDDLAAARVFLKKGRYRATLLYRNFLPQALVYDAATVTTGRINVWTGEIRSNTVVVTIK